MTRILVQRGSGGSSSSSNQNRSVLVTASSSSNSSSLPQPLATAATLVTSAARDEELEELPEHIVEEKLSECASVGESKGVKSDDASPESLNIYSNDDEILDSEKVITGSTTDEKNEGFGSCPLQIVTGRPSPPPPPVPPPKPSSGNLCSRRSTSGGFNAVRTVSSRRATAWPIVSTRTSPTSSRPSSPRSNCENEDYNSADEQSTVFGPSYNDTEKEHQFVIDIRLAKGFEVRKMLEDGNCLFRAVADQVYGDSDLYDLVRQMCIDYMERERDHFSQFITEGFTSYCKRKRRDKVYGNNVEIQALSEMYNRPIHIYSYSTEPFNIFHTNYNTDTPPIRLSFHHGNHYNSLVDPRRVTIGAGLGFSSLQGVGTHVDKDQIKAAIKAQQDQQIDNALLAEGHFYSDLELTEKEIERMVMETSRAEYLADDKFKQLHGCIESSTSWAEPSSSGARSSGSETKPPDDKRGLSDTVLNSSMQTVLSMGFSYLQAVEAYSIFGDDVDSMVCYLLETSGSSRRKGKATE